MKKDNIDELLRDLEVAIPDETRVASTVTTRELSINKLVRVTGGIDGGGGTGTGITWCGSLFLRHSDDCTTESTYFC